MLRPEEHPEYLDFARRLLAMRVNNLGLFAQYAAKGSQFERWLAHAEPVERFARFLRSLRRNHRPLPPLCRAGRERGLWGRLSLFRCGAGAVARFRRAAGGGHADRAQCDRVGRRRECARPARGRTASAVVRCRCARAFWPASVWSAMRWARSTGRCCGPRSRTRPRMRNRRRNCSGTGAMSCRTMCGLRPAISTGTFARPIRRIRSGSTSAIDRACVPLMCSSWLWWAIRPG